MRGLMGGLMGGVTVDFKGTFTGNGVDFGREE
jgi:hypothetical protein